ncbi:pleckstrin homology-like domain family B member 1 isoform X2 [Ornithodoros turicata]|uniref:pleckstrin homology-like domain family B member 1 isoform X2 n=1 Tax=Ornithodoros turicata TaxID=34597 RepID=UPI0031390FA9
MTTVRLLSNSDLFGSPHHLNGSSGYNSLPRDHGSMHKSALVVSDGGRSGSLKLQQEQPHLVSLGGSRLSTTVTIHPLPLGKTRIGRAEAPPRPDIVQDITIEGKGIEADHCYILNDSGKVTLHPLPGKLISLDGMTVTQPTRLHQGGTICVGRSNFFRFNHPEEAHNMKQALPNTRLSGSTTAFFPVTEPPGRFRETPPSRASPRTFDVDNNVDFVDKVSKFELLSHSSRSPPVTSTDNPRWFVRDGIRSTPPSRASSTTPLPSSPKSPRLVATQHSGRCTPSSPRITRKSLEDIRACEEELAQQHRRAVAERLRDQEQERQERHRLEEILSLCAEYERRSHDSNHRLSPDSNTEDATSPPASESSPPREDDKSSSDPSESSVTSVTTEDNKRNADNADSKDAAATKSGQQPQVIHNVLPESVQETGTKVAATTAIKTPEQLVNTTGPPEPAPRTIRCQPAELAGSHYHNRIKTNGSLTAAVAASGIETDSKCNGRRESCGTASDMLLAVGKRPLNATSSEDELTNILGGGGSSKSSPRSETDGTVGVADNAAPRPAPELSPIIPPTSPIGSPRPRIRTVPPTAADSNRAAWPSLQNTWTDESMRRLPERGGSLNFGKGSLDRPQVPLRRARSTSDDMSLLRRQREGSLHQIAKLKTDIITLEARVSEGMRELELEHALVTGELSDAQGCQKEDLLALEELQQEEMMLTRRREHDREQERLELESHENRIAHWEQVQHALLAELTTNSRGRSRSEVEQEYRCALEALEAERRAYEDIEFGQLEQDAHMEEEREAVLLRSHTLRDALRERQIKIRELMEQQKAIAMQIEQEKSISALDKQLIQTELTREQRKLDALDQQLRDLMPLKSSTHVVDDSSSSSDSECDTVFKPATQSHWNNIHLHMDSLRIPGNDSSFLSVEESESSSIVSSSDMPNESVSSSSDDRSRPTSEHAPTHGALQVHQQERSQALEEGSLLLPRSGDDAIHQEIRRREKHKAQRPLTRYLPVRGAECDLRQHVESAGHQVELCPHVRITSSSCCGYLHKLSGRWRSWKRRWFLFDRSRRALIYFSDKTQTKLKGAVPFQVIEEVYVDHQHQQGSGKNALVGFCVKTRERTFHLAAPTPEAMRIWVDVIFTGAEGYLEFMPDDPLPPRRT